MRTRIEALAALAVLVAAPPTPAQRTGPAATVGTASAVSDSVTAVSTVSHSGTAGAAAPDSVPEVRLAAREWFRDAKLGMFVHWGVYSLLGRGEWVMQNQRIPIPTYERLASTFDPVKFDAQAWVAAAKAAGVRYITITARHHDGFSMFATKPNADWRLPRTYALIHRLQPAALVIPNHHEAPKPGEDVQTFEQDLPGANTAGFNTTTVGSLPLETSLTMNDSWGFNITDRDWKSVDELIAKLVGAAGRDANLLLNVGPRPDGTLPPEALERLRALGQWLDTYGPSIYRTRGGPIAPRQWRVTTQRGDTVFVHVLDWSDRALAIPSFRRRIVKATMLATGEPVGAVQEGEFVTLTMPERSGSSPDRVIELITDPS